MPKRKPKIPEEFTTQSKEYQIAEQRRYYVVKHNDIIQQNKYRISKNNGNSLSLMEQKVLLYVISRIKPGDEELKEQIFDIQEFCQICGIQAGGNNYPYLKEIIGKLKGRVMWLVGEDYETTVSWIDKATIYKNSGKIKIRLDEDLKPYLLMLSRNYTQYPLHDIIKMKTKYGIMLYELLKSYAFIDSPIEFTLTELKESLDCLTYENFTNFKNKVLLPALKDINSYSELKVSVDYKKTGRTYTSVIFSISNLSESKSLEDIEERQRRFYKTEMEIHQMSLFDKMTDPGGNNGTDNN
jgi:plasmid replication initiation protein